MRAPAAIALVTLLAGSARAQHAAPLWTNRAPTRATGARATLADLADRARPAVVHVRGVVDDDAADAASGEAGRTSIGTGFIIHRAGFVVTNEHVVRNVVDLRVRLYDGRELPACVVGADGPTDIALLKVESPTPLPILPLGDSQAVRVGEPVVAIGNPFGFNHSVTAGIVSAKERVVDRPSATEAHDPDLYSFFIQTDASINLGNSGGPLLDATGAVVGISAAFWAGHPLQPAQGIGFAIPINIAKALLPRLHDKGVAPRSVLGVDAQPIDPGLEAALKLKSSRGALVASVEKGSPAEAGGLEPGDVVVTWGATPISTSEDLKIDAQLSAPGAHVKVALLRDGKKIVRDVVPRLAPPKAQPPHPSSCGRPRDSGAAGGEDVEVRDLPAARATALPGGHGVYIDKLAEHGSGAQAGLKTGDVILRVGKAAIAAPKDFAAALATYKPGDSIPVLARRSGYDFWLAIPR
ncbi:MAG TPA: trypsin-like peptidase domain-containing protein [Polyangia bacterium]|nr:trypsin-like peptidase domain-containing protein [Polyangia bacterium]